MSKRTPWARLLRLAQGFTVAPAAFWRLSVKEWRALAPREEDALTRDALEVLMQCFPDSER